MKKLIVFVSLGLAIVTLLVVVAGVIVLNLDPNRYKAYITGKISQQMGRQLEIKGDLKVAYYPWLHIEASQVFVENAKGFGDLPLLAADHVVVRVKTLPLLSNQLEMDTVVLKGARINLAKNKDNISNWEDSGRKAKEKEPAPAKAGDKGFDMANLAVLLQGGVDIQDAAVRFDDRAMDVTYTVSDLDITTGMVMPGEPVDLKLAFHGQATSPDISGNAALEGKIFHDFATGQYQIKPFSARAQLAGPSLGKTPAVLTLACVMDMDLAKDTISVTDLLATGMDTRVAADISLGGMESGISLVDMDLDVTGKDIAQLFKVFEGGPLAAQLAKLQDRSFDVKAKIVSDTDKGMVSVSRLAVQMLGADIAGELEAKKIRSATPSLTGDVTATGPDLPTLLQVAGTFGGSGSRLAVMGKQLAKSNKKAFHMETRFDVDMEQGRILLPVLDAAALGITVKANVSARHLGSKEADLDGRVALEGGQLGLLLTALDQPDLAAVLDSVSVKTSFTGNYQDFVMAPLQARFGLAGKQIPDPPVFVTLDAPARIQFDSQILDLADFSLKGLDLDVTGTLNATQFQTSPEFSGNLSVARFNLRTLMKKLNLSLPETSDTKVFEKVAVKTDFAGSFSDIRLTRFSAVLDDSQMNGNLAVQNFSNPDITCDLAVDKINMDRYMPDAPEGRRSGKKQPARPVTPETAAAAAAFQIPVELLRALKLKAVLAIENLVVSGANLSQVRVQVNAKDGILTKDPLSANLYKGTYAGKVVLDATKNIPKLAIDTTLKGVEVEPLLMDMTENALIRGTGDVTATLTTTGLDVDAMRQNLNGNMGFSFTNGAIKGFNAGKFLRSLKSLRESRTFAVSEQEETDFTELTGNPVVKNGVVFLDDLAGKSPALRVTGTGIVADIIKQTIDYKAVITVVETSKGQSGGELKELAGVSIPVFVKGPLSDPSITPDITGVISSIIINAPPETVDKLKKSVEKELGRFLKGLSD
jgi:AsmA protein